LAQGSREVAELLVGQRFQGRRVGDALAGLQRLLNRELGHQRLARARGSRHDDRLPGGDGPRRLHLEIVQAKRILGAKSLEEIHRNHSSMAMERRWQTRGAGHTPCALISRDTEAKAMLTARTRTAKSQAVPTARNSKPKVAGQAIPDPTWSQLALGVR